MSIYPLYSTPPFSMDSYSSDSEPELDEDQIAQIEQFSLTTSTDPSRVNRPYDPSESVLWNKFLSPQLGSVENKTDTTIKKVIKERYKVDTRKRYVCPVPDCKSMHSMLLICLKRHLKNEHPDFPFIKNVIKERCKEDTRKRYACPIPDCQSKHSMLSKSLKQHLKNVHPFFSFLVDEERNQVTSIQFEKI